MSYGLYAQNISDHRYMVVQQASSRAHQVSKEQLISHDLDKLAEHLCPPHLIDFARLRIEERRGTRLGNMIAVVIPFDGDLKTFQIRPSRVSIPNVNAQLNDESITATFPDDDRLDPSVDAFIALLNNNTSNLQNEWPSINAEAKTTCKHILEARKKQAISEKERDAKRSFPIN